MTLGFVVFLFDYVYQVLVLNYNKNNLPVYYYPRADSGGKSQLVPAGAMRVPALNPFRFSNSNG
jgi:hypothetical protein